MTVFRSSYVALGLGLCALLPACGGGGTQTDTNPIDTLDTVQTPRETEILGMGGKLFSIPSPVQAAIAVRKAGLKYQKSLTAPLDRGDALTGKVAMATMLGVYSGDLAYVTVHRDGQHALATLQAIEKLGARLDVSNAFDARLLDSFKKNLGSEDSLLRFSGMAFRAADQYLKKNDRYDVSALVLAGGWIESLYLTVSDPEALKDQTLVDRIGEQKNTLDGLVELISSADKDKNATALLKALKELKVEFDAISMTYTYEKPVTDAGKKTTFINSKTVVSIPADKVVSITKKVTAIRNMILA